MSLSGRLFSSSSDWLTSFDRHHIRQLFDYHSPDPVIYLGYPLATSTKQRNNFLDRLVDTIRIACDIHSQRSLSIRGRALIVNSLILSRLWHVLRVVSVPGSFFSQVKSLISKFICHRMFPRISFDTMCLPRSKDGLNVLNPPIQQLTLQLRWLHPLLKFPLAPFITKSVILSRLIHYLHYQVSSSGITSAWLAEDYRLIFLFPRLRPSNMKPMTNVFICYLLVWIVSLLLNLRIWWLRPLPVYNYR